MWTVFAGGVTGADQAAALQAELAKLLSDPQYGVTMSGWNDDHLNGVSSGSVTLHLPPEPDLVPA